MIFPFGLPRVSVSDTAARRNTDDDFILLDVRERDELQRARIDDARVHWLPLSELARNGIAAIPEMLQTKDREIIVFCHHGNRSRTVVAWFKKHGWRNVFNMEGGIDAYAADVDPEIGRY